MDDDGCLCVSFLINRLTKILCPDDNDALSRAVDILQKSYPNSSSQQFNTNTFQFRWTVDLEKKNKRDRIVALRRDMKLLSNELSNPNAIFFLLDHIRCEQNHDSSLHLFPTSNLFPSFEKTNLPDDFIPVLQGIDGIDFKWSITQKRFLYRTAPPPNLFKVIENVGIVGCVVKTLNSFMDSCINDGITHQNVAIVIREMLHSHYLFVSSIQNKFSSLSAQQLHSLLMSPEIEDLKAASILCHNIARKKGCDLYNILHYLSFHGDKRISDVSSKMKAKCFEIIDSFIRSWVAQGQINDPYEEFFIHCNQDVLLCSEWWDNRFSLIPKDSLPVAFNQSEIYTIFTAGKSLNFLRQWAEPAILDIDYSLPLNQYVDIASKETTKLLLHLMFEENHLLQAIQDIHDYVLIQRGDFTSSLLEIDDHVSISRRLTSIVEKFSNHLVREIDFKIKNDDWQLAYQALPPISAIFRKDELNCIKMASITLIRLKKTEYALVHAERSTRQISLVFYEMLHFVQLVVDFLNIHVVKSCFKSLMKVISNPKSFDEVLKAHTRYATDIARGCWVTEHGKKSRIALFRILENIELAINSPAALGAHFKFFRKLVQEFYDIIYDQLPTGKELSRPLLLMLPYIETKVKM